MSTTSATIRTDTRNHAVDDLSDVRIRGGKLPESVTLDDGEVLTIVEADPGQWEAQSDNGRSYPL